LLASPAASASRGGGRVGGGEGPGPCSTGAAALECAGQGVRVNALVTGNVDTPLFRSLLGAPPDGELEIAAMNPAWRIPRPEEIAAFVAFLLSDEAASITGAALAIDGGFTAQ
jgi:NAD(P)-dependent dehydrogenase (short-subunit alcohol dehydrogenase family)